MKFSDIQARFRQKKQKTKTLAEYNRELLVKLGKQQFKKLEDLGLNIPVALS